MVPRLLSSKSDNFFWREDKDEATDGEVLVQADREEAVEAWRCERRSRDVWSSWESCARRAGACAKSSADLKWWLRKDRREEEEGGGRRSMAWTRRVRGLSLSLSLSLNNVLLREREREDVFPCYGG